jgi:predicted porin
MQKKIIALAVASAAAGFASAPVLAQSTVSVYGIIDQAITSQNQSHGGTVTSLQGSGYATERLGFKGTEDMGNGLKANFVLEMGIDSNNGDLDNSNGALAGAQHNMQLFQRVSTVGLSGNNWGAVNFGRQYTPLFWNVQAPNDVFNVAGVGSIYSLTNVSVTRASNSIKYDSPNMSGFSVSAMYALGDTSNAGTAVSIPGGSGNPSVGAALAAPLVGNQPMNLGRDAGISANYANGPLSLGIAYNSVYAVTLDKFNSWDQQKTSAATGTYDFKVVKVLLGWQENKVSDNQQDRTTWDIGAYVPIGNDTVKLQYADRKDKIVNSGDSKLAVIGYVHPLSKRTTAYATYAHMTNDDNAKQNLIFGYTGAVDDGFNANGFQLGMSHNF